LTVEHLAAEYVEVPAPTENNCGYVRIRRHTEQLHVQAEELIVQRVRHLHDMNERRCPADWLKVQFGERHPRTGSSSQPALREFNGAVRERQVLRWRSCGNADSIRRIQDVKRVDLHKRCAIGHEGVVRSGLVRDLHVSDHAVLTWATEPDPGAPVLVDGEILDDDEPGRAPQAGSGRAGVLQDGARRTIPDDLHCRIDVQPKPGDGFRECIGACREVEGLLACTSLAECDGGINRRRVIGDAIPHRPEVLHTYDLTQFAGKSTANSTRATSSVR